MRSCEMGGASGLSFRRIVVCFSVKGFCLLGICTVWGLAIYFILRIGNGNGFIFWMISRDSVAFNEVMSVCRWSDKG
jgi:hypothetical protein